MPAQRIVAVEIAEYPAAAVKEDKTGQRRWTDSPRRAIEAQRDGAAACPRRRKLTDLGNPLRLRRQHLAAGEKQHPRLRRRQRLIGWALRQSHQLEPSLGIGIE